MKRLILFFAAIIISQTTMAQTKIFNGAWFDVNYPSNFIAKGSLKSSTSDGFESAFFKSPDNLVEFYIFSPQWNGEATDIVLKAKEKFSSTKSEIKGDLETKWWTITHSDVSYSRSYQQIFNQSQNTKWIVGIKYKNPSALEKYKKEYTLFKNSLKKNAQYTYLPTPYYSLSDACETSLDKCWKLGLCWDEDLMDYSTIGGSEMLFTYFPKKNSQCIDSTTYRLTRLGNIGDLAIWQYKNSNISIQVRLLEVETFFGYQLHDVRITNSLVNDCQPITGKY